MNDENQRALIELREFLKEEKAKPKEIAQHKPITWKDIAIGVYVGGVALAATSWIIWLFFTAIVFAALKKV